MLSVHLRRRLTSLASATTARAPVSPPPPTPPDGRSSLVLDGLTIVHRHGDRSPCTTLLRDPAYWQSELVDRADLEALALDRPVVTGLPDDAGAGLTETMLRDDSPQTGPWGKLTRRGAQQLRDLGASLREELVDGHGVLPGTLPGQDVSRRIGVWSTSPPLIGTRTVESVRALLSGLYPAGTCQGKIVIDATTAASLIPDLPDRSVRQRALESECLASEAFRKGLEKLSDVRHRLSRELQTAQLAPSPQDLSCWERCDKAGETVLRWNVLVDILHCLVAHACLPRSVNREDAAAAMHMQSWIWLQQFEWSPEMIEFCAGNAARQVLAGAARDIGRFKLNIFSAHDSTLAMLLAAFRLDVRAQRRHPPYASHLRIERWVSADDEGPSSAYLRFVLNGEPTAVTPSVLQLGVDEDTVRARLAEEHAAAETGQLPELLPLDQARSCFPDWLPNSTTTSTTMEPRAASPTCVVGVAQLGPHTEMGDNVERICRFLEEAGQRGVEMVVFPECATTGYLPDLMEKCSEQDLVWAEQEVSSACAKHSVACVLGTPHVDSASGAKYNSATLIDENGRVVGRQHKTMLVPPDRDSMFLSGGHDLNVFHLCGLPVSVIICHDKRYPELTRLPVMAGARLIVYMSCEQWHDDLPLVTRHGRSPPWSEERQEREIGVYFAQSQARAVENRVWLAKSNATMQPGSDLNGSHGSSCVVDPTGMVKVEASVADEELVACRIDLAEANASYATKALGEGAAFREWWAAEVEKVTVHAAGG